MHNALLREKQRLLWAGADDRDEAHGMMTTWREDRVGGTGAELTERSITGCSVGSYKTELNKTL